jgi:hypothetical protein
VFIQIAEESDELNLISIGMEVFYVLLDQRQSRYPLDLYEWTRVLNISINGLKGQDYYLIRGR